jgi:hypothetical protein
MNNKYPFSHDIASKFNIFTVIADKQEIPTAQFSKLRTILIRIHLNMVHTACHELTQQCLRLPLMPGYVPLHSTVVRATATYWHFFICVYVYNTRKIKTEIKKVIKNKNKVSCNQATTRNK